MNSEPDENNYSIPDISDEITEDSVVEEKFDTVTINYQHKIDRIVRVLENGQEKLKIALVIPCILRNQLDNELKNYVTDEQRKLLTAYCSNYLISEENDSSKSEELAASKEEFMTDDCFEIDYKLLKAIDILNSNQNLKEKIQDFIMKNEELFASELHYFYDNMEKFFQMSSDRIKTSAESDMRKEKYLHKIYHRNKKIKQQITEIQNELHEREMTLQWKLTEKQILIDKYEKELDARKKENRLRIQEEIANTEKQLDEIWIERKECNKKLEDEVNAIKSKYQCMLNENAEIEKNLREEKMKILNELDEWIKRYNTDIGKNTKEYEHLMDEFDEKQTKFDIFIIEFNKQKFQYDETVKQKENEDKMKHEEHMMLFMMNRAARIIQRTWRKYLQKRKKRGKGKKSKKK